MAKRGKFAGDEELLKLLVASAFSALTGGVATPEVRDAPIVLPSKAKPQKPKKRQEREPARSEPKRVGPLSPLEERDLSRRWTVLQDKKALGRLISAHLGLVIRISLEYRNSGSAMEDLIQEGNIGLTIAARRFDPNRATRLATYATYWIRACMLEHVVRNHGPVRIGTTRSQRKIFFGLSRARRKLERNGVVADCENLAGELGVLQEDVVAMTPRLNGRDVSLDAPRGFDDRRSNGDSIAANGPTPEDLVAESEQGIVRHDDLSVALKALDPRERAIIRARYMRQTPVTLASLGKRFNISRERVRQLETRAKDKIRGAMGLPSESIKAADKPAPVALISVPPRPIADEQKPKPSNNKHHQAIEESHRPLPAWDWRGDVATPSASQAELSEDGDPVSAEELKMSQ